MSSWGNKRLHQEVEEPSANARRWRQLEEAYQAEERVPVVSGVAVITMPDGSQKMVLASEAHELAANESASQDVLENEAGANVLPAGGQEDVEHGAHEAGAKEGATTNEAPQAVCGESLALPPPLQEVTNIMGSAQIGNAEEQAEEGSEEGKADQDPGKRGADTLKHVSRACGEVSGPHEKRMICMSEALSSDVAASVAVAELLQAHSIVRGVEVRKIMRDIYRRVHSSLSEQLFVEWIAKHAPAYRDTYDGQYLEFVMLDDSDKYASPLSAAESDFARAHHSTLTVSARALEAKSSDFEEVSRQVAAMSTGDRRMCSARGVYFYTIRIVESGIRLVYVGESVDVERRMNEHIDAIFEPDKADGPSKKRQGGHVLARAEIAGSSSAVEFDARVLLAFDEDSAFELAKSYVDFCRKNSKFLPKSSDGILEVARAIGSVGFLAEAIFTISYRSLNSESTDTRIGMNISQPGIVHTPTRDTLSLQHYQNLAGKAKQAKGAQKKKVGECRRIYKAMSLSGPGVCDRPGAVLELHQDAADGNSFGADHVYRAVTSAAPDAAPARIAGDSRVEVILTAKGQGNSGDRVTGQQAEKLASPKGVLVVRRFLIEADRPRERDHYFMWDAEPLPPERYMLDPDDQRALLRPVPDDGDNATEDTLYYRCVDRAHAMTRAAERMRYYRNLHGITTNAPKICGTQTTGAKYVSVPGHHIPQAKARFYYDGEKPPLRNPLDAVMERNVHKTQAVARAVCATGTEALAAANAFLSERIVWNTTVADAMQFCVDRSVSELPPATHQGTRTWRPAAAARG